MLSVGDYTLIKELDHQSYKEKEPFIKVLEQARKEDSYLNRLQSFKGTNWTALRDGLRALPAEILEKRPFGDLNKWVAANNPTAKLDYALDLYKILFDMPNRKKDLQYQGRLAVPFSGNIPETQLDDFRKRVEGLATSYETIGELTEERKREIVKLKTKITRWNR